MSESDFPDPVRKRICDHMNKDHRDALEYYLEYYAKKKAQPGVYLMTDIKKTEIDIEICEGETKKIVRIPLEPPLIEAKEARVRLIDMMLQARQALGYSRIQVKEYQFDPFQAFTLLVSLLMYWIFFTPTPLTPVEPFLRHHIESQYQLILAAIPPLIHTLEVLFGLLPLLRRHRVQGKIKLYWILAVLASGGPALKRFRKMVKEERKLLDSNRKDM